MRECNSWIPRYSNSNDCCHCCGDNLYRKRVYHNAKYWAWKTHDKLKSFTTEYGVFNNDVKYYIKFNPRNNKIEIASTIDNIGPVAYFSSYEKAQEAINKIGYDELMYNYFG